MMVAKSTFFTSTNAKNPVSYLTKISHNHVNNNHRKLAFTQIKELMLIEDTIKTIFKEGTEAFSSTKDISEFEDDNKSNLNLENFVLVNEDGSYAETETTANSSEKVHKILMSVKSQVDNIDEENKEIKENKELSKG